MSRFLTCYLLLAAVGYSADLPSQFPYSENKVKAVAFSPQGEWIITGIAGKSRVRWLEREKRKRLIGSHLLIRGDRVGFWNKKVMSWKEPFPTPLLSQESYDTHSREFWLDFTTNPAELNLPRYVSSVNIELGTLLATPDGHTFLHFGGVWFLIARI